MSEAIYVPVKPVNPTTPLNRVRNACNAIAVGVSYDKGQGIYAAAYPAERPPGGPTTILITSGKSVTLEPLGRLNKKKVETWERFAAQSVAIKQDIVWDLVLAVCEENKLTPAEG